MFSASARRWLAAAFCLGMGQQLFVVMRNQHLDDLGFSPTVITLVQGAGGAAGLVAGILGLRLLRTTRSRDALLFFAACNAVGFGIQAFASAPASFVAGAAIAGLGIQGATMAAAPLLTRIASDGQRTRLYATSMIALQTLPGVVGAGAAGAAQRFWGYRPTLAIGAAVVAAALVPLIGLEEPERPRHTQLFRLSNPRRAAGLLLPDALVMLAAGSSVPFLQVYFKDTFHLPAPSVSWIYVATMAFGTVGHLVSPWLVRRVGTRCAIAGAHLVSVPLFAILAVTRNVGVAAPAFVGRQIVTTAAQPVYASMLHGSVPDQDSGPVASYRMLVQSIVWAGGNLIAGPLIEYDGGRFRLVLSLSGVLMSMAAVLGFIVYPSAKAQSS